MTSFLSRYRSGSPRGAAALGLEGALYAFAVGPVIVDAWAHGSWHPAASPWRSVALGLGTVALLAAALAVRRHPRLAWMMTLGALLVTLAIAGPVLIDIPALVLLAGVGVTLLIHQFHPERTIGGERHHPDRAEVVGSRARQACWAALLLSAGVGFFHHGTSRIPVLAGTLAAGLAALLTLHWAAAAWAKRRRRTRATALALLAIGLFLAGGWWHAELLHAAWLWPAAGLLLVPVLQPPRIAAGASWWDPLLGHPARFAVTTFAGLCLIGTILLALPWSTRAAEGIALLDAAFTAVSAVCVTGLIVLDTPVDFSAFGQGVILFLIQVGGLGIMALSIIALHALGRRLSLRQERMAAELTGEGRHTLRSSLRFVLVFTLAVEGIGALLLALLFLALGDEAPMALWRGIFTAVSAFCNAGFALQSDSLMGYRQETLILHVVAALIVLGGLSPAVAALLPALLQRRKLPVHASLVLLTTAVLLGLGTALHLALEWDTSLAGLTVWDRLHNAWFQSVTLRTAGFNSVDIAQTTPANYLVMLLFMFIGGSPGGTAGGIKTTTFAVLLISAIMAVAGRREVSFRKHRIGYATLHRALAIVFSGIVVWALVVGALLVTQSIPAQDLVFEATSALATVGLSMGATPALDGLGKVVVILAMFLGRVGPLTLFTLFGSGPEDSRIGMPEARIGVT